MTESEIEKLIDVHPGEYRILNVDGTESLIDERPTIRRLLLQIGAETIDCVTLRMTRPAIVMIVDDTGMLDHKPVNQKASELMRATRGGPDYPYDIHGNVAIVNDDDFAD